MNLFKSKKQYQYKPFQRPSLFVRLKSKHRLKSDFWFHRKVQRKFYKKSLFSNLHRTYRSLCSCILFIIRCFIFIDRVTRKIVTFIDRLIQIIRIVHGWIEMLRSIFSSIYLIVARLMILTLKIYQIFYLLTILFEPFSNRTFEKAVRSFSHFVYEYYSSNGACYTLKARTNHVINRIRARWKKDSITANENDIYYDALNEEYQ